MSASWTALPVDPTVVGPDISHIVTEDDRPVDNIYSEKQMRLLTDALYNGWAGPPPDESGERRTWVAMANVGVFTSTQKPPVVPDVLLSVDVELHKDIHAKAHRTYFIWEFGKVPDVVIEVVSPTEGGELGEKKKRYRQMGVSSYVVWDPGGFLGAKALQVFELRGQLYVKTDRAQFEGLGMGLLEWTGTYEHHEDRWLRWCDAAGELIPTGAERAESERVRAESERVRAENERVRAENERVRAENERVRAENERVRADEAVARAERLAAKLRALGVDEG